MKNSCCSSINVGQENTVSGLPQHLAINWRDYIKMFYNWIFLFKKAYSLKPGLYFTGDKYDKESPLFVTCNFLSTVILLSRRLKGFNARLLVIDTNGINVWCSSSGGRFSADEILGKLNMYDRGMLTDEQELEIILPKLCLSGVRLSELRKNKIRSVIGPVYARELKEYLALPPYKDCTEDYVYFDLKARLYTVVPTMVQSCWYAVLIAFTLLVFDLLFKTGFHWQVIPITMAISFFYPLLFPWLPGKRFAVKGMSLAGLFSLYTLYLLMIKAIPFPLMAFYIAFVFATSILFALSYTGNSAVSNYSRVKQEIIRFLPLSGLFYIIALIFYFINGSSG